jgi:23S rRNA pseudouridine1911/1915/1917 synthase
VTALKDSDILYEDNHIIAVNKSAGLLSQPTEQEEDSLETRVKAWIKEKYNKPGNVFVGVIHRLDRPVSGIVLFAKTSKALARLNDSIRSHKMQKVYVALVEGTPKEKKRTLTHFLKQGDHCSLVSDARDPEAKQAILHYEVQKESPATTLLQVVLETGRYHQIRCQCAAIGHPIVGDTRYGAKQRLNSRDKIALHHGKLTFPHPVTQTLMTIETPPPNFA